MTNELKKTPLNGWHREHGAKMVDFGGWDMPVQYEDGIVKEHLATRGFGGLFDVSHMGRFRIKGKDRIAFMQKVLSNNCQALAPWESQYTIIANEQGGALDDAFLYRFGEEDYLLVVNASNLEKDWNHFVEQAKAYDDVVLEDHTAELAMIAFQGPLSKNILEGLVEKGALPEPRQNCLSQVTMAGVELYLTRTGYTGEPNSFELFVPADKSVAIWDLIYEKGKDQGVRPVGLGARDTLRLEAGMPLYGHELGQAPGGGQIPVFAIPLASVAVSFSFLKGDFIGRQALAAQFKALKEIRHGATEPPKDLPRRILPLALEDKGIARQGSQVLLDGEAVGVVTSGTSVPFWIFEGEGTEMRPIDGHNLRSLALGYVDSTLQAETEVVIAVRKRQLKTRVVKFHGRSDAPPYFRPLPVGWSKPQRQDPEGEGLTKLKEVAAKSLKNHIWRQQQCINLIPSEMTPSALARLFSISDPVGRYAEHRPMDAAYAREVYYYQGTDFIAWVEDRLAAELAAYLGCPQVEVRPISGQMANMTVFSSMVSWKNRSNLKVEPARITMAMTNHIGRGGHLSAQPMGALRDYIAKDQVTERFAVVNFPVLESDPFRIDVEATADLLDQAKPELVVLGKSMVLYREPVADLRKLIEQQGLKSILMYDMAHVLGLVGPHFQEPFQEGADIVTGSTHKTYFGTQRGVIGCNFREDTPEHELWEAIGRRAFPGMVSNHHLGTLLGLLLAAIEMNAFKDKYQPQVLANAKALAKALDERGVMVHGDRQAGFTETHQVVVNVGYAKGTEVARRLEDNNIIVNYQAVPSDEGFTASSGLRLGVSEMTRYGMKEPQMEAIASLIAEVVLEGKAVKEKAAELRSEFVEQRYVFSDKELDQVRDRLLAAV